MQSYAYAYDLRLIAAYLLPIVVAAILLPRTAKVCGKAVTHPLRWAARYYLRAMRPW